MTKSVITEAAIESLRCGAQAAEQAIASTSASSRRFYSDLAAEMTARANAQALIACAEALSRIADALKK